MDYVPSWVSGQQDLFQALDDRIRWRQERREMYERTVDVPRLIAGLPEDAQDTENGLGHPIIEQMRTTLSAHYGQDFVRINLALYRGGDDSVAWHGDYVARELPEAIVATVSLGAPRKFLLRPTAGRSVAELPARLGRSDRHGRQLPAHLAPLHPQGRARRSADGDHVPPGLDATARVSRAHRLRRPGSSAEDCRNFIQTIWQLRVIGGTFRGIAVSGP